MSLLSLLSLVIVSVQRVLLFLGFIMGTNSNSLPVLSGLRGTGRWFRAGCSGDLGWSGLGLRTTPLIRMMEA